MSLLINQTSLLLLILVPFNAFVESLESVTLKNQFAIDALFVVNTDSVSGSETNTEYEYNINQCSPKIIATDNESKVIIQAECTELAPLWFIRQSIERFSGAGYIIWEGNSSFKGENAGQTGKLSYKVPIPKAGTYRFNWRSYIGKADPENPTTEHNDNWLRIPGAADFYGKKDADFVYPKGSGKTPNPKGASGNGFFKVYMNRDARWTDETKTSDNEGYEIFARFDTAGTYTVEIAQRSNWHAIDSFMFTLVE